MKKEIKEGYNKIGQLYNDRRVAKKDLNYEYFDSLYSMLPKSGKLLDLGCGGAIPASLYFFEKGFDITGVDISETMIELAKNNIPEGNFFVEDISNCQFKNDSFDLIISTYALIHIPKNEQENLFQKIYSWLKKGGKTYFNLDEERYSQKTTDDWHGVEMHWSSLGKEEYNELFNKIGFNMIWSEIEHLPNGEIFYNVILEKR